MNKVVKLTDIVNFIGGSQPPKSVFSDIKKDGYVRLIQIRDYKSNNHIVYIHKDSTKKFCAKDDIMIGRYGPPVFQILRGLEGAYNVALMKATPKTDDLSKEYLYRFLQSPAIQNYIIGLSQRSAGQSGVNKAALEEYELFVPKLSEQKRIVLKIDILFEKIDKSIALHQKNINEANVFMGSVLNEIFGELEEKHLPMKRFDTYTKLSRGHNPPKKDFIYENKDGYMRFIQIRDGSSDKNAVYVPITKKLHTVTKEDLLLVAYRQVGKVFKDMEGAFNVALCKIENKDKENLDTTYLYYLIQSKYVKGELLKRAERALIPSMSIEHLKSIEIPTPPLSIQQKTVQYLDQLSQKTETLKQVQTEKMESLKALKASILDRAFRGEI